MMVLSSLVGDFCGCKGLGLRCQLPPALLSQGTENPRVSVLSSGTNLYFTDFNDLISTKSPGLQS